MLPLLLPIGLAAIVIKIASTKAKVVFNYLVELLKGGVGDQGDYRRYGTCVEEYGAAVTRHFPAASKSLGSKAYSTAIKELEEAAMNPINCETPFVTKSPLFDKNQAVHDLAALAAEIVRTCVKHSNRFVAGGLETQKAPFPHHLQIQEAVCHLLGIFSIGLAAIVIRIASAKAKATLNVIVKRLTGAVGDQGDYRRFGTCSEEYEAAVERHFPAALKNLSSKAYSTAIEELEEAAMNPINCETPFVTKSPLFDRNQAVHDLAAMAAEIVRTLRFRKLLHRDVRNEMRVAAAI